jgi:hypothetical protein
MARKPGGIKCTFFENGKKRIMEAKKAGDTPCSSEGTWDIIKGIS